MGKFPTEYGTSPVGRLISGDPFTKQTTDANNRPIPPEKQPYWFAVAIDKAAPGVNEMMGLMHKAASAGYANAPHILQQIQQGISAPQFSWKIADGDEQRPNAQTGQPENVWKHGAGCWIFKFSTTLQVRSAKYQGNVPVDCSADEIKRGYFVQVAWSCAANGNTDHTAGVYLNPQTICLVGYGEAIVGGPSLDQQFTGGPGAYVPPGMSSTPLAPTGAPGAVQPPAPQQPMQPSAPGNAPPPMPSPAGNGMPAPSAPNGATGSPGSGDSGEQPPAYGGYMQPPAGGGGMPGT